MTRHDIRGRTARVCLMGSALCLLLSAGPAAAQHSNSASLRIGVLEGQLDGEYPGTWAAAADLYVNLTARFGIGLELGMNRFPREGWTDKYYQAAFLFRNRETWGRVRPYLSGGGGLYLFHPGEIYWVDPAVGFGLRPHSPPTGYPPGTRSGYAASLGWTLGLGAELDVLPGPLFLEGDVRGHLVLASFTDPGWIVASIGLGLDWVGGDPG